MLYWYCLENLAWVLEWRSPFLIGPDDAQTEAADLIAQWIRSQTT